MIVAWAIVLLGACGASSSLAEWSEGEPREPSRCFSVDTGVTSFCGLDCDRGQECPAGSICVVVIGVDGEVITHQCAPEDGLCNGGDQEIAPPFCRSCIFDSDCE